MSGLVSLEKSDHIAVVSLDRPEALNAISGALADDLAATMRSLSSDDDVWAVLLRANGEKAFCVGADLKERARFKLDDYLRNREQIRGLFEALRSVPQPTIAAPFGFALGGGFELVLSCDVAVAAEGTVLGLPEVRVGLLPAGGGTQLLARKIGVGRAKELILRGTRFTAEQAHALGLVSEVVAPEALDEAALDLARDICKSSPVAVREAKRSIDAGFGEPLERGIEIEHESWRAVIESQDRAEGIAAFNAKRRPKWRNR